MRKTIRVQLNSHSINNAIQEIEKEKRRIREGAEQVLKLLSERGVEVAKAQLSGHTYTGETIGSVKIDLSAEGHVAKAEISIGGSAILFLEFGAGLIGYGHPRAAEFGMGPGTYPGNGNWDNPGGWYYPTTDAALAVHTDKYGQMWAFSRGTQPLQPMEMMSQYIQQNVNAVVKEVFGNG